MRFYFILFFSLIFLASCGKTTVSPPIISENIPGGNPMIASPIPMIQSGGVSYGGFDDPTNKKNQEIYDRAMKSLDELQCKDITNDMTRSMCWDTIIPLRAKRDKDETICDILKDPMTKNACSTSIILEKAQTQGNRKICAKLGDDMSRQACITQVSQSAALKALDPNKCRTISNEMDRSSCEHTIAMKLATENGDISACEKLDPMTRSGCEQKAMIAQNIKNGNTNSCSKLDPMMKGTCILQSLVERALVKNDLTVCASDATMKTTCETEVAKKLISTTQDPKYCDYFGGSKNMCLLDITTRKAIGSGDKSLCATLSLMRDKLTCESNFESISKSLQIR